MQKDLEEIYSKISEEQGIPLPIVRHVVSHQFNFVRQTMEDDLLGNVLLHNFGSFKIKKRRIDSLIRSLIKKIRSGKLERDKGIIEIKKLWKARQRR